jgi:hypothetical protein
MEHHGSRLRLRYLEVGHTAIRAPRLLLACSLGLKRS